MVQQPPKSCFIPSSVVSKQRGSANIITAVILSAFVAGIGVNAARNVASTADSQRTVHAVTHGQSLAWAAAEATRLYLEDLSYDDASNLVVGTIESIEGLTDLDYAASFEITSVDVDDSDIYAEILVVATDSGAQSTIQIELTYHMGYEPTVSSTPGTVNLPNDSGFYSGVAFSGGIDIRKDGGQADLFAVGNVTASGSLSKATGLNSLTATGDIDFGSSISIDEIYSNGDVTLSGGAESLKIQAMGDVSISGGASAKVISSNGDVYLGTTDTTAVNALGAVYSDKSGGHHEYIRAAGGVLIESSSSFGEILSKGDTILDINWPGNIESIQTESAFQCGTNKWWGKNELGSATAKDFVDLHRAHQYCTDVGADFNGDLVPDLIQAEITIDVMDAIEEITYEAPKIDVWPLKDFANFVFTYDGSHKVVTVNNVSGIPEGDYFLGTYDGKKKPYLCQSVDSSDNCTSPVSVLDAYDISNSSTWAEWISYKDGEWSIPSSADGIIMPSTLWFEGDLSLKGKGNIYVNSFYASGNISTGASWISMAPNYAGVDPVCNSKFYFQYVDINGTTQTIDMTGFNGDFDHIYATDLCDFSSGTASCLSPVMGNMALMAGGYDPSGTGDYSGGAISTGGSTVLLGSVATGDAVSGSGSTLVFGQMSAGGATDTLSAMKGSVVVDLRDPPSTFDSNVLPGEPEDNGLSGPPESVGTSVVGARYLN